MRRFAQLLILALAIVSCTDDSVQLSDVPSIEFVSITPEEVVAYQEKVVITIRYTDGNGDLGENDTDVRNLVVTDSRNDVGFKFRIPELAPAGSEIAITGELPIELEGVALLDTQAQSEVVQYTVQVTDRAGNQSNVVTTLAVTVNRE